jgi:hypothetical protein
MKWTNEQIFELKQLCKDEEPNAEIAAYFGVPVTEIHRKRSDLGITMPKVKAANSKPGMTINPEFEAAVLPAEAALKSYRGLEMFSNAGETCIVLARTGNTALIVMPGKEIARYAVPLEHKPGATDWWQGRYFNDLGPAWDYYCEAAADEA